LTALREADPELVCEDSAVLGAALRRVLDRLPEGGRALAVGHSPTNEAAVIARRRSPATRRACTSASVRYRRTSTACSARAGSTTGRSWLHGLPISP
jgi:hypothetical protein